MLLSAANGFGLGLHDNSTSAQYLVPCLIPVRISSNVLIHLSLFTGPRSRSPPSTTQRAQYYRPELDADRSSRHGDRYSELPPSASSIQSSRRHASPVADRSRHSSSAYARDDASPMDVDPPPRRPRETEATRQISLGVDAKRLRTDGMTDSAPARRGRSPSPMQDRYVVPSRSDRSMRQDDERDKHPRGSTHYGTHSLLIAAIQQNLTGLHALSFVLTHRWSGVQTFA